MKYIILKISGAPRYFAGDGKYTRSEEKARGFGSRKAAEKFRKPGEIITWRRNPKFENAPGRKDIGERDVRFRPTPGGIPPGVHRIAVTATFKTPKREARIVFRSCKTGQAWRWMSLLLSGMHPEDKAADWFRRQGYQVVGREPGYVGILDD